MTFRFLLLAVLLARMRDIAAVALLHVERPAGARGIAAGRA